MACYAYSVLTRWFSSVYSGAESRTSSDQMAKQVVTASSVTPGEVNDSSQLPETTYDIPDIVQPTKRKGGDTDKRRGHRQSDNYSSRDMQFYYGPCTQCICQHKINRRYGGLIDLWWRSYVHLDKEPGKLYSVKTKGGRNSDSAWRNHHENIAPLLQNVFC